MPNSSAPQAGTTRDCPTCEGHGFLPSNGPIDDHVTCYECKGSGVAAQPEGRTVNDMPDRLPIHPMSAGEVSKALRAKHEKIYGRGSQDEHPAAAPPEGATITDCDKAPQYMVRKCRDHWHVTSYGEDVLAGEVGCEIASVEEALRIAANFNNGEPAFETIEPDVPRIPVPEGATLSEESRKVIDDYGRAMRFTGRNDTETRIRNDARSALEARLLTLESENALLSRQKRRRERLLDRNDAKLHAIRDENARLRAEKERRRADAQQYALALRAKEAECSSLSSRVEAMQALINTPELNDFAKAVPLEAAHQRERWGDEHDARKEPQDWFWTLGYLAGKAMRSHTDGDVEKAKHHTITSAALLANWHARIMSEVGSGKPEGVSE